MVLANNVDFDYNEAQNVVIHNSPTFLTNPKNGMVVYLTQSGAQGLYLRKEGNWINLGQIEALANGAINISTVSGIQYISVRVDNATLEINGAFNLAVRENGIGVREINTAQVRLNNFAAPNANVGMGNFRITNLGTPTANSDAATKEYVDLEIAQKIASLGEFIGDWAGPGYPTVGSGPSGAIRKGDWWRISAAFNLGSESLEVGDALFAKTNAPGTTDANWFVLQSNVGEATATALGLVRVSEASDLTATNGANTTRVVRIADLLARTATTARTGLVSLATQAEVNTGTNSTKAVTPNTLAVYVNAAIASDGFVVNIGNGTATSISVTHNLNSKNLIVQVVKTAGDEDVILVPIRKPTVNSVAIDFSVAPTTAQYKVLIKKVG